MNLRPGSLDESKYSLSPNGMFYESKIMLFDTIYNLMVKKKDSPSIRTVCLAATETYNFSHLFLKKHPESDAGAFK